MENEYIKELRVLQDTYAALNKHYFGGTLEPVIITLQSETAALGHFTVQKVWKVYDEVGFREYHEINLSAESLWCHYFDTCAVLMHEMVHLFCFQNNITDTSRQGRYHNKEFKRIAEEKGLVVSYLSAVGWGRTDPTDKFKEYIDSLNFDFKKLYRATPPIERQAVRVR